MSADLFFWACAVCFGDPASAMSRGVVAGAGFLMGVVLVVLGGIATAAIVWSRRAKRLSGGS